MKTKLLSIFCAVCVCFFLLTAANYFARLRSYTGGAVCYAEKVGSFPAWKALRLLLGGGAVTDSTDHDRLSVGPGL